ncbi:putative glycine cleavage system H protein, mitochondrial [Erysiphe neolycopersici]|uniref:Glycine cleavage system H protein n=1 Tax=Erysiphe neolycopersici TaxID=212602 RepID=A0A420HR83_9PEZI|nr:putative glycine cleavage system H protein, mitochondrial [Erysiphe neolycopersici]
MSFSTYMLQPMASRLLIKSNRLPPMLRLLSFQSRNLTAIPRAQAKKYTKDHEWISVSEDGKTGLIGISKYASDALGEVVYVELPEVPMSVTAGDSIGAVESVKSASDINSPVTCKITSVNMRLDESPKIINEGPEEESSTGGWVARVELGESGIQDLQDLMDPQQYKEFTGKDSH